MSEAREYSAPFRPPFVKPAAQPLRFPVNLIRLLKDNLEIIPERAYWEPLVIAPGPPRIAFITGPKLVQELLLDRASEFPKGKLQVDVLKPVFGKAMISCEGREWRWQRSVAAPLFRHEELLAYGPIMSRAAQTIVEKWASAAPDALHAINKDAMRAAFHVISNTMLTGGAERVLEAIELGHADYYRNVNWWVGYTLLGLPHWLPRPGGRAMRDHEKRMRRAVAELVLARRNSGSDDDDLLGRMVRATDPDTGQSMSNELLVDNVVSFLMAGYDTTALALTWALYMISQSPDWERRIVAEVEQVAGDAPIGSVHVPRLVAVQQVLNETLRLFPTAPVIVRDFTKDTRLGEMEVPAGTIGIIPIYAVHRHRSCWDSPDRFDPSRFSPDNPRKPGRFEFLPFGAGPRICIGAAFALIEATIMLATFVRAARFTLAPGFDVQPSGRMFLIPKNGLPMRVTMRRPSANPVAAVPYRP